MTSAVMGTLKKVDWVEVASYVVIGIVVCAILNAAVHSMAESNMAIWFGVVSFVVSFLFINSVDDNNPDWQYWTKVCLATVFALFFMVSPYLHLSTSEKVWIVGDETTVNHAVLWRSPFSKFATSIDKKQNVLFNVTGETKDGASVAAKLSGEFSVSDDEKMVIRHFGKMRNPDVETANMLKKILQKSFKLAIGTMTVADIAMAKNNFALEHVIATIVKVDDLGLVGSGPIAVSDLHPYFGSK